MPALFSCLSGIMQMDEEELYSSVARSAPEEDATASNTDDANNDTFGSGAASNNGSISTPSASGRDAEPGGHKLKGAWGSAGAGVAAVSGRHALLLLKHLAVVMLLYCCIQGTLRAVPCS